MELIHLIIAIIVGFAIYAIIERAIHSIGARVANDRIIIDLLRGIADKLEVDKIYLPKVDDFTGKLKPGDVGIQDLNGVRKKDNSYPTDFPIPMR